MLDTSRDSKSMSVAYIELSKVINNALRRHHNARDQGCDVVDQLSSQRHSAWMIF